MPNFDFGKYFLTALIPIKIGMDKSNIGGDRRSLERKHEGMSHIASIREALALLPLAKQSPATADYKVVPPFLHSERAHFARLFILDDVTNNGRDQDNAVSAALANIDPTVPRKIDHLECPYLVLSVEFDAETGSDSDLQESLAVMWHDDVTLRQLKTIFRHCYGFDRVTDARSFFEYIKVCQIETTMPYNNYGATGQKAPFRWRWNGLRGLTILTCLATLVFAISTIVTFFTYFWERAGLKEWAFSHLPLKRLVQIFNPNYIGDVPFFGLAITGTAFAFAVILFFLAIFKLLPRKRGWIPWAVGLGLVACVFASWKGAWYFWHYAEAAAWFPGDSIGLDGSIFDTWAGGQIKRWSGYYITATGLLFFILAVLLGALSTWLFRYTVSRPFPRPPSSTLPDIRKALYIQQRFVELAIAVQGVPAAQLYDEFGKFIEAHAPDKPEPTQPKGVIKFQIDGSGNARGSHPGGYV